MRNFTANNNLQVQNFPQIKTLAFFANSTTKKFRTRKFSNFRQGSLTQGTVQYNGCHHHQPLQTFKQATQAFLVQYSTADF